MSTSGGYHEYIRVDIMSTLNDVPYIGGCSVHWGFQYKLKGFYHLAPPHAS